MTSGNKFFGRDIFAAPGGRAKTARRINRQRVSSIVRGPRLRAKRLARAGHIRAGRRRSIRRNFPNVFPPPARPGGRGTGGRLWDRNFRNSSRLASPPGNGRIARFFPAGRRWSIPLRIDDSVVSWAKLSGFGSFCNRSGVKGRGQSAAMTVPLATGQHDLQRRFLARAPLESWHQRRCPPTTAHLFLSHASTEPV